MNNRQYYHRGEQLENDDILFKYYHETNHEGKYIIDKIEKNNKKIGGGNQSPSNQSKKQRRKRHELSINATKYVSKHNVEIMVKFE